MYAEKSTPHPESHLPKGPKPVFIRTDGIRNEDKKPITGEEIYVSLVKVLNGDNIAGIQQIRRLWRIYLNSHTDRVELISNGLTLRGASVPVFDVNPFTKSRDENLTRVAIKDIPLSVSDDVIRAKLQAMKHEIHGDIYRQKLRVNGQLTNCLNGDRVLHISPPIQPLPRKLVFGNTFMARVYHSGQPEFSRGAQATCSRCLQAGHHVSRCTNEVKCQVCKQSGHMRNECPENRQTLRSNLATPDASSHTALEDSTTQDENTQQTNTNKIRQTRLADFVSKLVHRPAQNSNADSASAEVLDLRSPRRTRSASRIESSSTYASDGAIHYAKPQNKTRDEIKHAQETASDDQQSESGEDDSSLSPESPAKTSTTKGRIPLKRKKKSPKKKK